MVGVIAVAARELNLFWAMTPQIGVTVRNILGSVCFCSMENAKLIWEDFML